MSDYKENIKQIASKSVYGKLLYSRMRAILEKIILLRLSDYEYVKSTFKKRFGREIDLKNPKTYTEKLQWLKLFYRDDTMPICTDKYEVHNYLTELGYSHLLNELYGVYDDAKDIDFDKLPKSFVVKTTHGCSYNLICKNKDDLNWGKWVKLINSWLKLKVHAFGREWNYEAIKPRIIVEKFIDQQPLIDYKFMCFNGEPRYLQINNDKDGVHYVDFYDISWSRVDFTYEKFTKSNHVLPKPAQFEKMKALARELSAPFPYVRVDFYNPPNRIIFGEFTYFPGSGLLPLVPVKNNYDATLGAHITLPEPNNNLDIYKAINSLN